MIVDGPVKTGFDWGRDGKLYIVQGMTSLILNPEQAEKLSQFIASTVADQAEKQKAGVSDR